MSTTIIFNLTLVRNSDGTVDSRFDGNAQDPNVELGISNFIQEQLPHLPGNFHRDIMSDAQSDDDLGL